MLPVRAEATVWIEREASTPIEVRLHAGIGLLRITGADRLEDAAVLGCVDGEPFRMGAVHAPREAEHLVSEASEGVLHLDVAVEFGQRRMKIQIELFGIRVRLHSPRGFGPIPPTARMLRNPQSRHREGGSNFTEVTDVIQFDPARRGASFRDNARQRRRERNAVRQSDLILHHYPLSTYSEKVRLALGLKTLDYNEVITPIAMPKPDLIPLTGGYRRAPVMQIGADIYCDTQLILRKLEALHPEPTLFPGGCEGEATAIAWWAERYIFMPALGFVANVNNDLFKPDFVAERKEFGFILGKEDVRPQFGRHVQQLVANLGWFVTMLKDGRPFMLGDQVSAADLAAYPTIWFLCLYGGAQAERMLPVAPLRGWYERVTAIGYGTPTEIASSAALDIARDASPAGVDLSANGDPSGIKDGTPVTVTPDDTGRDPVAGTLVAASDQEVVIRRTDDGVGDVHLHFPRAGYDVVPV